MMHRSVAALSRSFSTAKHNVGILGMEMHIPKRFVAQPDLEVFDKVSAGKYTIGLGQQEMAFVDDREDINSICLTAVDRLLTNYNIDPKDVGRLEVGTETFVDKSKSTKTSLMQLFPGNHDLEGATVVNACYGGTAALFNSAAWAQSEESDGKYAVMVTADIAVYEPGPARPTGGVAAVAVLIGPDAPLALVPRARSSHCADVYDFYKPNLSSEYPLVDGKLSQVCYLQALDACYRGAMQKFERASHIAGPVTVDSAFQNLLFHSPYNKLVQQSFQRMLFLDAKRFHEAGKELPPLLRELLPFCELDINQTYINKDLDKALKALPPALYNQLVKPSVLACQRIGNSYTASSFVNLLGLVSSKRQQLEEERIGVFSYGSGAIATLYTLQGRATNTGKFSLGRIADTAQLFSRLDARQRADPVEYTEAMSIRMNSYGLNNLTPKGSIDNVPVGAFYLKEVNNLHHRVYDRRV